MDTLPDDLVLVMSGGGIRGMGHVGVISVLETTGILSKIRIFAGSSIGSFVGMLCCLSYSSAEMFKIMSNLPFERFMDEINLNNFLEKKFLCNSEWIKKYIEEIVAYKGFDPQTLTLQNLYELTGLDLVCTAVNRDQGILILQNRKEFPKLKVVDAVYNTMALPSVFEPNSLDTEQTSRMIDGGTLDNYPITFFDLDRVIGIRLGNRRITNRRSAIGSFVNTRSTTMIEQMKRRFMEVFEDNINLLGHIIEMIEERSLEGKEFREIIVDTFNLSTFETKLGKDEYFKLFTNGVQAAVTFLKDPQKKMHIPMRNLYQ